MTERDVRRERTQNLWTSLQRKTPLLARAAELVADPDVPFDSIGGLAAAKDELLTYACAARSRCLCDVGTVPPRVCC